MSPGSIYLTAKRRERERERERSASQIIFLNIHKLSMYLQVKKKNVDHALQ